MCLCSRPKAANRIHFVGSAIAFIVVRLLLREFHNHLAAWVWAQVAAAADAAQPSGAPMGSSRETRVKPFYEAPEFKQTYARQPSLVRERPPLPYMHHARVPLPAGSGAVRAQQSALQRIRMDLQHGQ